MLQQSLEDFAASRPAWAGAPLAGLAELRRRQGRRDDAIRLLDGAGGAAAATLCLARLLFDRGDVLRAAELGERLLRQVDPARRLERLPALELLVHARSARGELEEAGVRLTELREIVRAIGTAPVAAVADRAEGVLAAAHGEHERARALLEDALDHFVASGAPFEAALTRIELATTLVALGRVDAAVREASSALEALVALGAVPDAERARRLLALTAAGDARPALSRREREVLGLLADGLTNRQIAERLVVSEHTVHRHVTNILRKLGLPSRTAAAAHAVRAGLLEPSHR
jgi:DNA-binding NarL/FixJ family response regulator